MLPGAYPKFATAVVAGLSDHADVEVLDLSARQKRFANTGVDPVTVRERLLAATGHPPALDLATAEALSADVVFVDWADKGLTWVTQVVPEGTRVVVRLHGVDTLSAWLHTAEWDKVDDVIFPSDHLRRAAAAALGGRLDGIRQHVVANPVDVERYVLPKTESARTTLGMVGWAQQVKDPLWTLDVLAALRRHDPRWRLRLIGADFAVDDPNPVEREAARAFHARMADPLVADGVDFVGYTTRLPEHLREVGWAVSSSRREGFHIGLVEMAASGAVPVVRDWPVYAGIGGATGPLPSRLGGDHPRRGRRSHPADQRLRHVGRRERAHRRHGARALQRDGLGRAAAPDRAGRALIRRSTCTAALTCSIGERWSSGCSSRALPSSTTPHTWVPLPR